MINKNLIRKIILEELIRKLDQRKPLNEGAPLLIAAGAAVIVAAITTLNAFSNSDKVNKVQNVTNANPQNNIYVLYKNLISKVDNIVIPTDQECKSIAQKFADATLNYASGIGTGQTGRLMTKFLGSSVSGGGTDEDSVKSAIVDSKSKIALAKIAMTFNTQESKSLYDVLTDEFSATEQDEYVVEPIMLLPFIILKDEDGTEVALSEEEFLAELEKAKTAAEEGEKSEENEESGPSGDLGFGLDRPYVLNIIKTMNAYAKNKKLEGYTPAPEEDKWSPAVQDCWLKFAPHALNNCDLYNTEFTPEKIGDIASWPNMSSKMKSTYPGYTPNPRGCLAFCLDAYYCELKYGNQVPASSSGKGNGEASRSTETRETSSKKITVTLAQTGKNFTQSGFSLSGGRNPDNLFVEAILNQMSNETKAKGYRGGQLNIYLNLRGTGSDRKVTNIEVQRGGGQFQGFNLLLRNLKNSLESIAQGLNFPKKGPYSVNGPFDKEKGAGRQESIHITVDIPSAGDIEDLRP